MATILVKGVSEDTLKQLKRLKVELNCDTWAELLDQLTRSPRNISFKKEKLLEMERGVKDFISLGNIVSKKWTQSPTVLDESRKSRKHERI